MQRFLHPESGMLVQIRTKIWQTSLPEMQKLTLLRFPAFRIDVSETAVVRPSFPSLDRSKRKRCGWVQWVTWLGLLMIQMLVLCFGCFFMTRIDQSYVFVFVCGHTGFVRNRKREFNPRLGAERFPGLEPNQIRTIGHHPISGWRGRENTEIGCQSLQKEALNEKTLSYTISYTEKMPKTNVCAREKQPIYRTLRACADIFVSPASNRPYANFVRIFRWLQKKSAYFCGWLLSNGKSKWSLRNNTSCVSHLKGNGHLRTKTPMSYYVLNVIDTVVLMDRRPLSKSQFQTWYNFRSGSRGQTQRRVDT